MCDTKVMRVVTDWTPIAPGSDRAPRTRKGCEVLFFLFFFSCTWTSKFHNLEANVLDRRKNI